MRNNLKKSSVAQGSHITVTVDNVLDKITVNGESVSLKGISGDVNDWTSTKTVPANFGPGDVITIQGTNQGGPAGIIATLSYTDDEGKQQTLNTGAGWTCDGAVSWQQGANGVGPWGARPSINAAAQWIWAKDGLSVVTTTCQTTVPGSKGPGPSTIKVNIDDVLAKITVNGEAVTFPKDTSGWSVTKSIEAYFGPGDVVAITGTNLGGPAGILATLTYSDHGIEKSISTGAGWTCDGKASWVQGANGMSPWGNRPLVAGGAQWIWSSTGLSVITTTCQIKIPGKVRKACRKKEKTDEE